VSQQATTASATRWTRMVPALGVLFAVGASTIGLAAPATADTASYLQSVQPTYAYMSESQLLSAGHQACATARRGIPASDNTIKVSKDMGISTSAAYNIVVNSINHLGC
jgi:hypothetical protein